MQPTRGYLSANSARYTDWQRVSGTDSVELESPLPILGELPGIGARQVYLLKLSALTDEQRERLVAHLSYRFNVPFSQVREDLARDGCPILAEDVHVSFDIRLVI